MYRYTPRLAVPQVEYQVLHSGAKVLFVSGSEQQQKVSRVVPRLPGSMPIIAFDSTPEGTGAGLQLQVHRWQEWLPAHDSAAGRTLAEAVNTRRPNRWPRFSTPPAPRDNPRA